MLIGNKNQNHPREEEDISSKSERLELIKIKDEHEPASEKDKKTSESLVILLDKIKALEKANQNLSEESKNLSSEIQEARFYSRLKSILIYIFIALIIFFYLTKDKIHDLLTTPIKIGNRDISNRNYFLLKKQFKCNFGIVMHG